MVVITWLIRGRLIPPSGLGGQGDCIVRDESLNREKSRQLCPRHCKDASSTRSSQAGSSSSCLCSVAAQGGVGCVAWFLLWLMRFGLCPENHCFFFPLCTSELTTTGTSQQCVSCEHQWWLCVFDCSIGASPLQPTNHPWVFVFKQEVIYVAQIHMIENTLSHWL